MILRTSCSEWTSFVNLFLDNHKIEDLRGSYLKLGTKTLTISGHQDCFPQLQISLCSFPDVNGLDYGAISITLVAADAE